jgi:hypothetical protein
MRHAVGAEHDGVALDELGHLPREHQVDHLFGGRLHLGDDLQLGGATLRESATAAARRRRRA